MRASFRNHSTEMINLVTYSALMLSNVHVLAQLSRETGTNCRYLVRRNPWRCNHIEKTSGEQEWTAGRLTRSRAAGETENKTEIM